MKKPKHRIVNGHMEWTGDTVRETQAARDATLNKLFARFGDDVPTVILAGKHVALVFQRHSGGYSYLVHWDGKLSDCVQGDYPDRTTAENFCRSHLAQTVFEFANYYGCEVKTHGLELFAPADVQGRINHVRWIRFQVEYRKAHDEGMEQHLAHQRACERSSG